MLFRSPVSGECCFEEAELATDDGYRNSKEFDSVAIVAKCLIDDVTGTWRPSGEWQVLELDSLQGCGKGLKRRGKYEKALQSKYMCVSVASGVVVA